jgi:hypothetical protein
MSMTNTMRLLLAAFLAVGAAQSASAVTTVHNNLASFLASTQPGFYLEDFSGVAAGPVPSVSFGPVNGFSYTVQTPAGSVSGLFNDPGLISTDNAADMIEIVFTGAPVTAVGGNMYATDISFAQLDTNVTIALSDGTVETYFNTSASDFRGFTTTGPAITSLTIDAIDPAPAFAWATLDNLYVGAAVPEPASVVMALGALSLLSFRRRK